MRSLFKIPLAAAIVAASVAAAPTVQAIVGEPRDGKAEVAEWLMERELAAHDALGLDLSEGAPCQNSPGEHEGLASRYYPCKNVDLVGYVHLSELGGAAGNDSWGWTDPEDGTEIAIMGTGTGTAFVKLDEVQGVLRPVVLAYLEQAGARHTGAGGAVWRDVKVNNDHAYIVTERGGGIQVFDLTRLREYYGNVSSAQKAFVTADTTFGGPAFMKATNFHNIVINEETDFAYGVGGNCNGGLYMVDISDAKNPAWAGCFGTDGYTHDAQCVVYRGPDTDYNGNYAPEFDADGDLSNGSQAEICFAYNEDSVTIVDVSNKLAPKMLSKVTYDTSKYTHQGWLTEDHEWIVFNDEIDDQAPGQTVSNTTTYIANVADLDADVEDEDVIRYVHPTLSVDHNLYIKGDLIFEANYNAGLRILRFTPETLATGELEEVGYFDVDPGLDAPHYGGAWNVYPYFESGTIVVSTLDEGMFLLKFNDPADAS